MDGDGEEVSPDGTVYMEGDEGYFICGVELDDRRLTIWTRRGVTLRDLCIQVYTVDIQKTKVPIPSQPTPLQPASARISDRVAPRPSALPVRTNDIQHPTNPSQKLIVPPIPLHPRLERLAPARHAFAPHRRQIPLEIITHLHHLLEMILAQLDLELCVRASLARLRLRLRLRLILRQRDGRLEGVADLAAVPFDVGEDVVGEDVALCGALDGDFVGALDLQLVEGLEPDFLAAGGVEGPVADVDVDAAEEGGVEVADAVGG